MRRTILLALAALTLGGCSSDQADPAGINEGELFTVDFGAVAYGITGAHPGAGLPELGRLKALPDAIKLTAEQEAKITELLEDFQAANQADLDAVTAILAELHAAREGGKTRAEITATLERARPIRLRLAAATAALKVEIDKVLTVEQRTWLVSRSPARCYPTVVAPLSAQQREAIRTLHEEYREATEADRAAVHAALVAAREAKQDGATAAEIRAILDAAKPAMERLQAAGDALRTAVNAVLTANQRASGCFGPPAGGSGRQLGR